MSKGPGKCQKLLLDKLTELSQLEYCPLVELLPARHSKPELQSVYRAARELCRAGKISLSFASVQKWGKALVMHHLETVIVSVPNPKAGQQKPDGFYETPLIDKCLLREKLHEVDTYDLTAFQAKGRF